MSRWWVSGKFRASVSSSVGVSASPVVALDGVGAHPPEHAVLGRHVSNAILWLVSDEARSITGVALPVDAEDNVLDGYNPIPTK